jgi:xanthine dehydrogenase YagT iron-sulfur-binding subunit
MKDQQRTPPPQKSGQSGHSRRAFLKGSGIAAAATALATGPGIVEAADKAPAAGVVGPGPTSFTLEVNGTSHKIEAEPRSTLLDVLRYHLNLTGAKPVSIDGSSGASTVWVDGKTISANTTLALDCVGKKIQTVESLGGNRIDPVPMAFLHQDGMQCGFCTPGFVVAVRAFLDKNPKASEQEIRSGLNGNLCRCGTYHNVIQAALEVVKGGQ